LRDNFEKERRGELDTLGGQVEKIEFIQETIDNLEAFFQYKLDNIRLGQS
jgi:hypothetical protein